MSLRDLFLLEPGIVFLNHGSFGACALPVFERYQAWQRELERRPVEFLGRRSAALLGESLRSLAAYLDASPDRLVYLTNTTTGVNTVARSLCLMPGDEVLTTNHEYGACDNVWEHACRQRGACYVRHPVPLPLPPPAEVANRIWEGVTPATRILYLSHITSTTALLLPVEELCRRAREAGILTVIDGAHAPGHTNLHLDALGADVYVGNCHKWLCAPKGSAFLYARPEIQAALDAVVISWGYGESVAGHTAFDGYLGSTPFLRRHLWQGTRDIAAFLSVPAAVEFLREHQWDRVRAACHDLAAEALENVVALTGLPPISGPDAFLQMAALPVPPCDAEALKAVLYDRFRVEVPVTSHGDQLFVRISVQGYNTPDDTAALVDALRTLLREGFFRINHS